MTKPVFLLRPEPGWSASAAAAREIGLKVGGEPLARVEPVPWTLPDTAYHGLLIGSANVFRNGGQTLEKLRDLPVHCVGASTAEAARKAGFTVETVGQGGLASALTELKGRNIKLLRLCGEARVPLDPPSGITIEERIVYRVEHLPIPQALAEELSRGGAVLLHSGELARHFASECNRLHLSRKRIEPILIGPRLVPVIGSGWHAIHIADRPDDATLLALAAQVCSKAG